ncbi:hypothetical protein [uncultured Xanthomonas sp.]|uniref:hypothetical protein n=1 Tax=uncultured Xanthomonas sp. TaxID=152831 RepID=UPI002252740D|nr:hypothetical protein [uncultured Xanthomonas sp.]
MIISIHVANEKLLFLSFCRGERRIRQQKKQHRHQSEAASKRYAIAMYIDHCASLQEIHPVESTIAKVSQAVCRSHTSDTTNLHMVRNLTQPISDWKGKRNRKAWGRYPTLGRPLHPWAKL